MINSYNDLIRHYGHKIDVVVYAGQNVAIECEHCNEILIDFEKHSEDPDED